MTGRVLSLHRWPVKSMGGEPVEALRVDARGAGGDRTHAVHDVHRGASRVLTARQAPRLLAWHATYGVEVDPADPPEPAVRAPDGSTYAWSDPALASALEADLDWQGRGLRLHRDVAGQQDLADSLLVTFEATRADAERRLARPLDLRRFRPNLHVDLPDASAWAEHGWEGRRLLVGDTELELLHPCERCVIPTRDPDTQDRWAGLLRWLHAEHGTCFGINARATAPATIQVGDAVELR